MQRTHPFPPCGTLRRTGSISSASNDWLIVPQPLSAVAELLAGLRRAFEQLRVRWYLFGAQAALVYGAARLTADVDVTVETGDIPTEVIVETLRRNGFDLSIEDPEFVRATRVLPAVHVPTRIPVDIVLGGPGLEELFASRAHELDVAGVRVPVARAEDLIVMKVLAGRDKDLTDVEAVLLAQRELDLDLVYETLRVLEQALDQSDLVPLFEQVLLRTRRTE